jgi:hypothetical protein
MTGREEEHQSSGNTKAVLERIDRPHEKITHQEEKRHTAAGQEID